MYMHMKVFVSSNQMCSSCIDTFLLPSGWKLFNFALLRLLLLFLLLLLLHFMSSASAPASPPPFPLVYSRPPLQATTAADVRNKADSP